MRFQCQPGCIKCCEEKGFVYVSPSDIVRLADFLGMTETGFKARYVYSTKNVSRLRVPRHSYCPFLTPQGCSVHPAKPIQCRTFPFWPELVNDKKEWNATAKWCPGMGKGPHVSKELVRISAKEMEQGYPYMYDE
jgi:Fe-S-cluster containining protein